MLLVRRVHSFPMRILADMVEIILNWMGEGHIWTSIGEIFFFATIISII